MLNVLFSPPVIGITAVFLSVLWMLRDEKDKTRPLLVIALVINLFYGWLLSFVMGRENGLVPWKFDYLLLKLDDVLGIPTAVIAGMLQRVRTPLLVIYQLMVPMMIAWFLVARRYSASRAIVVAYAAEMLTGPVLYAILPGCGPVYTFRAQWLHPPVVQEVAVRLSGMPNAFPSLHAATALVFVSFARGKLWQAISLIFFAGTILATIATGEHYAIDLIAGVAFGCFAANAGRRRTRASISCFALVLAWSLTVRLAHEFLIGHAIFLRMFAGFTLITVIAHVAMEWRTEQQAIAAIAEPAVHASA